MEREAFPFFLLSAGTTAREPTIVSDCTAADGWRRLQLLIDRLRKTKTVWRPLETRKNNSGETYTTFSTGLRRLLLHKTSLFGEMSWKKAFSAVRPWEDLELPLAPVQDPLVFDHKMLHFFFKLFYLIFF